MVITVNIRIDVVQVEYRALHAGDISERAVGDFKRAVEIPKQEGGGSIVGVHVIEVIEMEIELFCRVYTELSRLKLSVLAGTCC